MTFHVPVLQYKPVLDPGFMPAALWNRAYEAAAASGGRPVQMALCRDDGTCFRWSGLLWPDVPEHVSVTRKYVERLVKFLLWQKGGNMILVAGADDMAAMLAGVYAVDGERHFDRDFIGTKIFGSPITVRAVDLGVLPEENGDAMSLGRNLQGCRIGFDLGGSDRKCAAVIDGEVVFSEEIVWDPYFQSDPNYHIEGIQDSLLRAAAHLPRIDAIGGSTTRSSHSARKTVRAKNILLDIEPQVRQGLGGIVGVFKRERRAHFTRFGIQRGADLAVGLLLPIIWPRCPSHGA